MKGDEFEAREMHDGAAIVHRDKKVSRGMAALLAGFGLLPFGIAILVAVMNESSSKPLPSAALPVVVAALAALGVLFFVLGVVFAVLRTVITERAVHVKYGLWGPTIPLASIESCRVVAYDWTEFGGWGIRSGKNGAWAYVPSSGPVVELLYTVKGASRRVLIGGSDAAAMAGAIERARQGSYRVAVGPPPDAATEVRADEGGEQEEVEDPKSERERGRAT